jgi:hypothetical protein
MAVSHWHICGVCWNSRFRGVARRTAASGIGWMSKVLTIDRLRPRTRAGRLLQQLPAGVKDNSPIRAAG